MNIILTLIGIQLFLFLGNKGHGLFSIMKKNEKNFTNSKVNKSILFFKSSLKDQGQTLLLGLLVLMFFSILLGTQFIRLKRQSKYLKNHFASLLCLKGIQKTTKSYLNLQIGINQKIKALSIIPNSIAVKSAFISSQYALKVKYMLQMKEVRHCVSSFVKFFLQSNFFSLSRDSLGGLKLLRTDFQWKQKNNSLYLNLKNSYTKEFKYSLQKKETQFSNSTYGLPSIFF